MSVIIRLQGLPLSAASGDIRSFFSGLGIPDGAVNIVGGDVGDAFIGFATDEDARQAMRKNNGLIHNSEVRLFLSSRSEMKDVIDSARAVASAPPSMNAPPPRYGGMPPPFERDEPPRFGREEPPRFGREEPSRSNREEPPRFGKGYPPRYGRDGPQIPPGNGGPPPFTFPPPGERFNGRGDERRPMDRPPFEMGRPSFPPREMELPKSDNGMNGRDFNRPPWQNRDRDPVGDMKQQGGNIMNGPQFANGRSETERHAPMPTREPGYGIFGSERDEGGEFRKDNGKKEESWRKENNRSFDSNPSTHGPPPVSPQSTKRDESDSISFFGRGPSTVKRGGLLPPPIAPPSLPSNRSLPSLPTPAHQPKEEAFVELTRLPADLLRPSSLEEFLAPSTPLALSSVKVVYGPAGIHMQSFVRFTSAMDAISALKKDGEQGVKIRISTKEAFDGARDGPPPIIPPMMPSIHGIPPPTVPPAMMMGMPPNPLNTPNLLSMPLMNPNEMLEAEMRREGMMRDEGRGERRRREESPPRRDERRRSPRSKRPKGDRICVRFSNLHFRTKEPDIRRMLGDKGIDALAIKKVFTEDNSPSDLWVLEFASEHEANRTVNARFELHGRSARTARIDEPEADRLLRQKYRSPPRRGEEKEREGERRDDGRRDSFEEKVRMQQEAIEMERRRPRGDSPPSLAGAFSAPVFTTNRGFMRGGRGGGRGMRGEFRGGMRGGRGGVMMGGGRPMGAGERNCLLVSNMPPLPAPQALLEHLRVDPPSFVRCDQIAPDAAIVELTSAEEAIRLAERAASGSFPPVNGRRLIVAAMARRQIEEEFNLRAGGGGPDRPDKMHPGPSRIHVDPEVVRSIGAPGCVVACDGFPRDLAIDEIAAFFDGFPLIESSVRMRMEGGEGTGEFMLAMRDGESARRAVETMNGRPFRGVPVTLCLL